MNEAYSFDDVLIVPQYSEISSRSECDISPSLPGMPYMRIPIFAANMDTVCELDMAIKMSRLGGVGIIHRYMSVEKLGGLMDDFWKKQHHLTVAVGCLKKDKERIDFVEEIEAHTPSGCSISICVDIAHGDSKNMTDTIKYIRDKNFLGTIIAGNVCTYEGASRLFDSGADIVKVGVGPGSVCSTRIKTGCGYPQLSAIKECAEAGIIIADGGIRTPGDAAKAIAVGADAVMIGGMLAGTDCVPGYRFARTNNKETISFRGMASWEARADFGGESNNAEGVSVAAKLQPRGSTRKVIEDLVEGIKSAMSYSGTRTIPEFQLKNKMARVSSATLMENHPHKSL